jgi:hypothetical protein
MTPGVNRGSRTLGSSRLPLVRLKRLQNGRDRERRGGARCARPLRFSLHGGGDAIGV